MRVAPAVESGDTRYGETVARPITLVFATRDAGAPARATAGDVHQVAEHTAQEEHHGQGDRLGPDRSVAVVGGPAPRFVHGWAREYPIRGGGRLRGAGGGGGR